MPLSSVPLRRSDPAVKRLLAATFPAYKGRKISAVVWDDRPIHLDLSWSGGTKDDVVLVDTANGRIGKLVVPSPWSAGAADPLTVPAGAVLAVHSYFCGVDVGVTFYVRPAAVTSVPALAGPTNLADAVAATSTNWAADSALLSYMDVCPGCDWASSGYTHRHDPALDGSTVGCCAHDCGKVA